MDKLEAGKTYRLIDKEGYLHSHSKNVKFYKDHFKDDCVTIAYLVHGAGMVHGNGVIYPREYKFFEVKNPTTLSEITLPFGELDNQTKKDLVCAWVDGAEIEFAFVDKSWECLTSPSWVDEVLYRVKPPVSEKDKLIAAAQQKLKEAQETLDKLQKL